MKKQNDSGKEWDRQFGRRDDLKRDISKTDLARIETPNSYRRRCIDDENLQGVGKYDVDVFHRNKDRSPTLRFVGDHRRKLYDGKP